MGPGVRTMKDHTLPVDDTGLDDPIEDFTHRRITLAEYDRVVHVSGRGPALTAHTRPPSEVTRSSSARV